MEQDTTIPVTAVHSWNKTPFHSALLRCIKLLTGVLLELFLSDQKTINFLGNKL
jgi:hypothetical protein